MELKKETKMIKIFFTTCLLMTLLLFGSMDIPVLKKDIQEIRKMYGQEHDLKQEMDDFEYEKKQNITAIEKLNEKKLQLHNKNEHKKTILKKQKEKLIQRLKYLITNSKINDKTSTNAIKEIGIQISLLDKEKDQIENKYIHSENEISIQKNEKNKWDYQLNLKKSEIENEIFFLSEKQIKKKIKVSQFMQKQFEIVKSKMNDASRKQRIIEQEKKFLISMKKYARKFFHSYQTLPFSSENTKNITGNDTFNTVNISDEANIIGKIYLNPIKAAMTTTIYSEGVYVKGKKEKDESKDEFEFFVDIEVLEESCQFLEDLEK